MIRLPTPAQSIIDTLSREGYEIYAVGGSVRDLLMNRETKGWDFTTNATPDEILRLFPDSFYDNDFGTVGIKIYGEATTKPQTGDADQVKPTDIYEITTYRSESGYRDFRHPDQISWGKSLNEDLSRRDFTINALAFDGKQVIDLFGGQTDLTNKLVRAVGNPQDRFKEDALRMMRAVRIGAQLGFLLEPETKKAIADNVQLINKISAERIRDELLKLMSAQFPADGILLLKNSGVLAVILPELDATFGVNQKSPNRHHIYDVGTHSVMSLKHTPSTDPIVRLATLLHDIGKVKTVQQEPDGTITFYNHEVAGAKLAKNIAFRLRLSRKDTDRLFILVRWHQFSVDEKQTDSAIRRIIRRIGTDNLQDMLDLRTGDRLGGGAWETSWRLELFKKRLIEVQKQPFSVTDLKVNGYDVMKILNIKPGPKIGQILNTIFDEVDKGSLPNDRDLQITRIKELAA